jgi:alpha-tubulin suppressor-like RCC1 family protein
MTINLSTYESALQSFANNVTTANTTSDFLNIAKAIQFSNSGQLINYPTFGAFPNAANAKLQFALDVANSAPYYSNGSSWLAMTTNPPSTIISNTATIGIASNIVANLANTAITAFALAETNGSWQDWTCGYAAFTGALGLGTASNVSTLVQVGSLDNWKIISCGYSASYGIRSNGSLYSWGGNGSGELGLGNTTPYSSPVQVGSLTNWKSIYAGSSNALAIKTDGTLWAWGYGATYGILGLGTLTLISSPVQVGSLNTWKMCAAAKNINTAALAIKTDGTLWAWGAGASNALGLGSTTNVSTPVQVGTATNWASTYTGQSFSLATKYDGTLWAWGTNSNGQLGLGTTTAVSTPVQVGTLTNWLGSQFTVSPGAGAYWLAVKQDGTLWGCGNNTDRLINPANTSNFSSPIQVGSLTNWKQVGVSAGSVSAIKQDGTLWSWGNYFYQDLGLGSTISVSTPVQVGTLTNWKYVAKGGKHLHVTTYPFSSSYSWYNYPIISPYNSGSTNNY